MDAGIPDSELNSLALGVQFDVPELQPSIKLLNEYFNNYSPDSDQDCLAPVN